MKLIKKALISVYDKSGLLPILEEFKRLEIKIVSTGGTYEYIRNHGFNVQAVEDFTSYPSILGGRVKTLHPSIFGGILARRNDNNDISECKQYNIEEIDLVIVDLYPFNETVEKGASEEEIIEKIDIGGISLIRAAAKNFKDVLVIPSKSQYSFLLNLLNSKAGYCELSDRKLLAIQAFSISATYDQSIFNYFSNENNEQLKLSYGNSVNLRYGENPHQQAVFYGALEEVFFQHYGKQISYNNLLDIDSALKFIAEFDSNTFGIFKHLNPCGVATCPDLNVAWKETLSCDPVSAFGGIIVTKAVIDKDVATEIDKVFFEVILASGYHADALEILKRKKNRIILQLNELNFPVEDIRTNLTGLLVQDRDIKIETESDLKYVTNSQPTKEEIEDLLFANKIVKHLKSNALAIVKNKKLLGAGMGQPSRIDALKQGIAKAHHYGFDLKGAVLASDAYFPFSDSVQAAHEAGITAIIEPGGSVKDSDSINYCNQNNVSLVFTGIRHFKH